MKTSTKLFILFSFTAMLSSNAWSKNADKEQKVADQVDQKSSQEHKMGLMPFASLDLGSADVDGESKIVGGISVGVEYTVYRNGAFSTNSKASLKAFSREEGNFITTTEIDGTALLIGQTVNYDFEVGESQFQFFGQGEVGYGRISATSSYSLTILGQDFSGEAEGSDSAFIADASLGIRYFQENNFIPYLAGGYRYFKSSGLDYEGDSTLVSQLPSDIDMSSAYISFGVGYSF